MVPLRVVVRRHWQDVQWGAAMSARGTWRTVFLAVVLAALPSAATVAWILDWQRAATTCVTLMSYFAAAVAAVTAWHDRVFFATKRAMAYLANVTTLWAFRASYTFQDAADVRRMADVAIDRALATRDVVLIDRNEERAILSVLSVTVILRIADTSNDSLFGRECVELVFDIPSAHTPYRNLRRVFEGRLEPLLEEVRRSAQPAEERYELSFGFPEGQNPFFGMFVRRLQQHGAFRWTYMRRTPADGSFEVTRNTVNIVTGNAAEMRAYFREFSGLSLSASAAVPL